MSYRASNARDRDAAARWRALPMSERLRRIDFARAALLALFVAAFALPAIGALKHWLG